MKGNWTCTDLCTYVQGHHKNNPNNSHLSLCSCLVLIVCWLISSLPFFLQLTLFQTGSLILTLYNHHILKSQLDPCCLHKDVLNTTLPVPSVISWYDLLQTFYVMLCLTIHFHPWFIQHSPCFRPHVYDTCHMVPASRMPPPISLWNLSQFSTLNIQFLLWRFSCPSLHSH